MKNVLVASIVIVSMCLLRNMGFFCYRGCHRYLMFNVKHRILLHNSRVSNQNGVSPLNIMLEIHHSGRKPSTLSYSHSRKSSVMLLL